MSNKGTVSTVIASAALALALALPAGIAAASSELDGANLGKTTDDIRASLTAQGYEVRKVKSEDGKQEAYAVKDGKLYEIYVDPVTGLVIRVKEED